MAGKIWHYGLEPDEYLVESVKKHMNVDNIPWLLDEYLDTIKGYYEEKKEEEKNE